MSLVAPVAPRKPTNRIVHGVEIIDDYAWLKAENWREVLRDGNLLPVEIRTHLEAENAYADAMLTPLDPLIDALKKEMRGRIAEVDSSVPSPDGAYAYFQRFREGGQHRLVCRLDIATGVENLLVDGDAEAYGKAFFQMSGVAHSPDHRLVAWGSDDAGSEFHIIRVRDAVTGVDAIDHLIETTGVVVWTRDSQAFFYVRLDKNHRSNQVFLHVLGQSQDDDLLIYEDIDPGRFLGIDRSQSGRFAFITANDHESSQTLIVDLDRPRDPPRLVAALENGVRYDVDHGGPDPDGNDRLFILTNADGAEDFKLVAAPLDRLGRANWIDFVPHRPGTMIIAHAVLADWIVRLEREEGLPRIVVLRRADGEEHAISFAEEAYALGFDAGLEPGGDVIRLTYSSMTTPNEVWSYDLRTRARTLLKRQRIPSGHDPADYVTRRLFATAPDGERVPVSILHRADFTPGPGAACHLYGYGAYGSSMPASFSANRLSVVDRGAVYAIAHVRGGTEKGWGWYVNGKRENKPNTFTDFIAVARLLIDSGYASAGRIAGQGRSAGGMLMGAVANMAPELFGAIIAEVPFVDVLTTMLDDQLPLTPPEWPEWGNPITDESAFRLLLSYSPVDQVRPLAYPAILATGGLTDPRVTYWEPAKWVARLRAASTSGRQILLKTEMSAGHGGQSGRFDRLSEIALSYAFALQAMGLAQRTVTPAVQEAAE